MPFSAFRPTGTAIAPPLWPEALFSVGAFCTKDHLVKDLLAVSQALGYNIPIASVYGSPNVVFNSGRVVRSMPRHEDIVAAVTLYNTHNIAVFLTFSNTYVGSNDLNDACANRLLELLWHSDRSLNGVILSSDILSDYIKTTFPGLVRKASVLKVVADGGIGSVRYYQDLLAAYDCVTLHPDDSLNLDLLRQLVPVQSRVEMLVNECCLAGCPSRVQHYDLLSRIQMNQGNPQLSDEESNFSAQSCNSFDMARQLTSCKRNLNMSSLELKAAYDLGFRAFKLQGRTDYDHIFLFDCARFLFEGEILFPFIFKLMCSSQSYGLAKGMENAAEPLRSK